MKEGRNKTFNYIQRPKVFTKLQGKTGGSEQKGEDWHALLAQADVTKCHRLSGLKGGIIFLSETTRPLSDEGSPLGLHKPTSHCSQVAFPSCIEQQEIPGPLLVRKSVTTCYGLTHHELIYP